VHKNTKSARPCAVALWRCKSDSRAQCTEHKSQLYLRWIVLPVAGTLGRIGIRMHLAGADVVHSSGTVTWVCSLQEADTVSSDGDTKALILVPKPKMVDSEGCGIFSNFSVACQLWDLFSYDTMSCQHGHCLCNVGKFTPWIGCSPLSSHHAGPSKGEIVVSRAG
jgi:hypothetical protein